MDRSTGTRYAAAGLFPRPSSHSLGTCEKAAVAVARPKAIRMRRRTVPCSSVDIFMLSVTISPGLPAIKECVA